jgi:ABC-2 type transport system ATP-binding protein
MRVLTGFTPPTEGTAAIAGYDVVSHSLDARRHIGYLPESVPLYLDMTVMDYLRYMGQLRGMNRKWIDERLPVIIDTVRLGEYQNALVGKLSKGYRQRVGIAQAIIHEPDVLILDEPTIGIDPIQVVETRSLISELGGDHTLILSSHILPEIGAICRRVLVIHEGRIVADDDPENLSDRLQHAERIEVSLRGTESNEAITAIRKLEHVVDVRRDSRPMQDRMAEQGVVALIIDSKPDEGTAEDVARTIVDSGWGLVNLHPLPMTLEEIFLQLTTEEEA